MITVTQPKISARGGQIGITATIDSHPFYVRWRGEMPPSSQAAGDAMLCFALIPAMAQARDLTIQAPVSKRLLFETDAIQNTLLGWFPERFRRISISARPSTAGMAKTAPGAGTFFTGGVDSMFTLMTEREQLSDAVYVHGYDIRLDDSEHRDLTSAVCRAAASEAGVDLIEVETDIRDYTDQFTNWLTESHGSALAAVAHLLSGQIGSVLIPASNSYEALPFIGSDPLLDPRWRGDQLAIIHHGADRARIEKAAAIANWPTAQKHLRVCWQNLSGQINCGQCEKCARTLLGFQILGAYDDFVANFAKPISTATALAIDVAPDPGKWYDWEAMYQLAAEKDEDQVLIAGLAQKLDRFYNEQLTRELRPRIQEAIRSEHWQRRWPMFRNKVFSSIAESDPDWLVERIGKNLPALREALATQLANDPGWLKKKLRRATWKRRFRLNR